MEAKCKHCRKNLFKKDSTRLLTCHSERKKNLTDVGCGANDSESCSYISVDNIPEWIERIINQESWTKGRLHCPRCNNRIGSFNFVNEVKCDCGKVTTPPIRITNSKVDISFDRNLN